MTKDAVSAEQAAMLAATLNVAAPEQGAPLPILWHWIAFRPSESTSALASDGHPHKGGFLPALDLPRRMWAGGSLRFQQPLHVGEPITRTSVIENVVEKRGSTGAMVFVTVAHKLEGERGLAMEERQDIVYLPMPQRYTPPKAEPVPTDFRAEAHVAMSEALLFRYSACTFNAHRIHYDLPYAREVEKYPGLVVHGPLQATLLAGFGTQIMGRAPDRFAFRGVHPMFHDADLRLIAQDQDNGLRLCTARGAEHQGLIADAFWEEG